MGPGVSGLTRAVARYRPGTAERELPPSGAHSRARQNLAVIRLLGTLTAQQRAADARERCELGRWSGWGACPELFDERRSGWAAERQELLELVGEDGYAAARRTTLNAHYTHPEYASAMWELAGALGFTGGRVLEPGCGAGVFIGMAPSTATELVGVELDQSTAAIAQELYPDAKIIARSFAEQIRSLRAGSFELTIGNVPFGKVNLYDPVYNSAGHAIHNHFILKSLALTKPGGLAVLLTSRYTLDASNPAARREISELADLVVAIRLPSGAHRRVAGTEAVTDLLVLRRREPGTTPAHERWVRTEEVDVDGGRVRINSYLAERPEHVLGTLGLSRGLYGNEELVVERHDDVQRLARRIYELGERAGANAPTPPPGDAAMLGETRELAAVAVEAPEGLWDGHLLALSSGEFAEVQDGLQVAIEPARTIRAELRALLTLRDGARELLSAEAASFESTPAIDSLRGRLRDSYEEYVRRYGPINRFSVRRTGCAHPETGEERKARVTPPAIRALRGDPFAPLVLSLEIFDEQTGKATAATLLGQRVVAPRAPVLGVDTPQDALAVCLDTRGRVDLRVIAGLLGATERQARAALGELVYDTPHGALVPAAEYLSGNVREKLEQARAAAIDRPWLAVNVAALQRVLPPDLGADEVRPQLGAAWITVEDHKAFLQEILDDRTIEVENGGGGVWGVRGNNVSLLARSEWGTERVRAPAIVKALLEQRPIQVTDESAEGRRVLNPVETAAAQEKAQAIGERFAEWCWEDPARAQRLLGEYNRRFNSIVLRDYTQDGERLTLPGLVRTFTPMRHQKAAVARMLCEPAVGLFHQVGAGKTAEMIIGATELRRLGMVRKPVIVVPNHMLEQFTREWLQLYPQARILAASTDELVRDKRRRFVARASSNEWDGVLMTRSAFERIPVSPATQQRYFEREVDELRQMLAGARGVKGGSLTVKRIERMVLSAEQQLKRKLDTVTDLGISFEQTGIDYIILDEAHGYKNLRTVSNIRDAQIDGSQRASDLHMKLEWLRERHGTRVVTMATATPIANSITEAHVMQRYLRPDLLRAAGVEHFDQWAATFAQTVTEIEMAPTGGGNYRMNTRFAQFSNVPEMLRMWHVFADVKTAEELNLPTPGLRPYRAQDGTEKAGPRTVVVPASAEMSAYLGELAARAEAVRSRSVTPEEDNMLKISSDGRKAALDMRLIHGERATGECKLERAARVIAHVWRENRERTFLDPDSGQPSPVPGAMQIVFCDLSTPVGEGWNAYRELRELLIAEGMPASQVRFVHEARNDAEKGRLFQSCRNGHVAVLIGSTEKMGVGTNIQTRAAALHHIDCPWRPADVEQREGRILRQGNQFRELGGVEVYRYVVERSFDAYMWQTVERKAKFIAQITRGRLDMRELQDVGDSALSYAEVKALASGDRLILEHARAGNELERLRRLERAWGRNRESLRYALTSCTERTAARGRDIAAIDAALAIRNDTNGDAFRFTIAAVEHAERKAAAEALGRWAQSARPGQLAPLGEIGAIKVNGVVKFDVTTGEREAHVTLVAVPVDAAHATLSHLQQNPLGLLRQVEHRVGDLENLRSRMIVKQQHAEQEAARARDGLDRPFKHTDELKRLSLELEQITEQMKSSGADRARDGEPGSQTDSTTAARSSAVQRWPPRPRPPALSPAIPEPQAARHPEHRIPHNPNRGAERS